MAVAKAGTALEAAVAVKNRAPKRVKFRGGYGAAQRPVVTTMTVVAGLGFLNTWLVDRKPLPEREYFVRLAILGFGLALMAEIAPKLGKSFSYLVLAAVVFDRSQKLLTELQRPARAPVPRTPGGDRNPLITPTTPVTLYVRRGPMTANPPVHSRPNIRRPKAGAAFQI